MNEKDLEEIGLNKNEAKVYYTLILKGQATASEMVKHLGVHRNIVYDNLDKLIEKGFVSFIVEGNRKKFTAQDPDIVVEYLEGKKQQINLKIEKIKKIIPDIRKTLSVSKTKEDATIYRGIKGIKKVLSEIVKAKKTWAIGITNESVEVLGETFWKNYNKKVQDNNAHEWLLWNSNFVNNVILGIKNIHNRLLPKELDQVTEIIMWEGKVATFVFSHEPIVFVVENEQIFKTNRDHFEFLWKQSNIVK